MKPIAVVARLRRHPVKSMLGEDIRVARIDALGIEGDRTHALRDVETGKIASAKNPRLWGDLLRCQAKRSANGVQFTLPDGVDIEIGDSRANSALSSFLGRSVEVIEVPPADAEFERARPDEFLEVGTSRAVGLDIGKIAAGSPAGRFVDYAPVHFMNSATVHAVADSYGGVVEAVRYRPNIIFDTADGIPEFFENEMVGGLIAMGDVRLRVIVPTPRCAVPTLAHGPLAPEPNALRHVTKLNRPTIPRLGRLPCLGAYAHVEQEGTIAVGDEVMFIAGN